MPAEVKTHDEKGNALLVKRITLDLPDASERHRERCRYLGIPEDTPWNEREKRGREKRRRNLGEARSKHADLQVGL